MFKQLFVKNPYKCYLSTQQQLWCEPFSIKFYSKTSNKRRQLGGYEYKEDTLGFKSKWRIPFIDRENFWKSKFDLFGNRNFAGDLTRYNPDNYKFFSFKQWRDFHAKQKIIFDQKVIEERLSILGCELAAAHFVVYRGGGIKFYNHDWIRDDKKKNREYDEQLPNVYHAGYVVEGIDFSGTKILYEGLKNIEKLQSLKWLSFNSCPFFNTWCLDRISGEYGMNLEYLDISYTDVTHQGLGALYRFNKLKTLKVEGLPDDPEYFLMYLELKKTFPELNIEGIETTECNQSEISGK
uniref:Uncharacterized protein n=1 Tax=Cuerna arida TaxID=1464854 RepID=A0A1B6ERZ6_9HEMI